MNKYEAVDYFRDALLDVFINLCKGNDFNKISLFLIVDTINKVFDECVQEMGMIEDEM